MFERCKLLSNPTNKIRERGWGPREETVVHSQLRKYALQLLIVLIRGIGKNKPSPKKLFYRDRTGRDHGIEESCSDRDKMAHRRVLVLCKPFEVSPQQESGFADLDKTTNEDRKWMFPEPAFAS